MYTITLLHDVQCCCTYYWLVVNIACKGVNMDGVGGGGGGGGVVRKPKKVSDGKTIYLLLLPMAIKINDKLCPASPRLFPKEPLCAPPTKVATAKNLILPIN